MVAAEPRVFVEILKYVHGAFNISMAVLFLYQGSLGLRIRRARRDGSGPPSPATVLQHRRNGFFLAPLGIAGFLAGMTVAFVDEGEVFNYPPHFITGLLIATAIAATYLLSRTIEGRADLWRDRHGMAGGVTLVLYTIQILSGIALLFFQPPA